MKHETNFHGVTLVNHVAGKTNNPTWQAAEQQAKVIAGEYDEVIEAVALRRLDKLRDGIADLLVTSYGMASILGYDANADMAAVLQSLFTRFDRTAEDAAKTKAKYIDQGVETLTRITHVGQDVYYITISTHDQINITNGETVPAGKFLKSWQYSDPVLPVLDADITAELGVVESNLGILGYRPYVIANAKLFSDIQQDEDVDNV
jgi:NTP pyrophosphatase (non-canonical NTP hydrolase)